MEHSCWKTEFRGSWCIFMKIWDSFTKNCIIICRNIQADVHMSILRTSKGPITVKIMCHCLLEWGVGGSYTDISIYAGISPTASYSCINSDALAYNFHSTEEHLDAAAQVFEALSFQGAIKSFVAKMEFTAETSSFKQWDRQCQGIFSRIHWTFNHKCIFVYAAVVTPGGANNIAAFINKNLPLMNFVISDSTYFYSEVCSLHSMVMKNMTLWRIHNFTWFICKFS